MSCKEMGKKLSDMIKVGDHIKFNAILVGCDSTLSREISYLATTIVFASSHSLMRTRDIPGTAPNVTLITQLEPGKIKNFHTVTGLMGKVALTEREKEIIRELETGVTSGNKAEIDSDDEVEVLPENAEKPKVSDQELKAIDNELDALVKQFNPRDLRKLILSYTSHLATIATGVRLDRGIKMLENLFIAMGKKSNVDPRGMKVGHMFLTQAQVKNIQSRGIMSSEHVFRSHLEERTHMEKEREKERLEKEKKEREKKEKERKENEKQEKGKRKEGKGEKRKKEKEKQEREKEKDKPKESTSKRKKRKGETGEGERKREKRKGETGEG